MCRITGNPDFQLSVPDSPTTNNMELDNLLDPTSLPPAPLADYHYREWIRLVKKSTRKRETILKFLLNFIIYSTETASLIFTLITGLILPDDKHESYAAFGFYFITCCVTATVNYLNSRHKSTESSSKNSALKSILLNLAFVTKPLRYARLFSVRRKRYRVIQREEANIRNGAFISESSIKSLSEIAESQLVNNRIELYESYFQNIPMALLQSYFLFQTHQRFQLCNIKDFSRLVAIITPLFHAAMSSSAYESTKQDYEQTLHFLQFYRSRGNHPMVVFSNDLISLSGAANLVAHLSILVHRYYTATYFLALSPYLTLTYVSSVFLLNLVVVYLFPQTFLEVHENPPYGVSTFPSYAADRFINIFSNVGTRFNKYSSDPVIRYRIPLVLTQVLHFIVPLGVVYSTSYLFDVASNKLTLNHTTTLNETLESCPELYSIYYKNEYFTRIGEFLFSSYKTVDDKLQTYSDAFSFFHLLWLLFYVQVVVTCVYAYSDLMKRRKQDKDEPYFIETFPILTAYAFYGKMLREVLKMSGDEKVSHMRKLMVATVLEEHEFYKAVRVGGLFWRKGFTDEQVRRLRDVAISRLSTPDDQVDGRINSCVHDGHVFLNEFLAVRDVLVGGGSGEELAKDKKLFLGFFAYFDRKVCRMTSDRVIRVFHIVGVEVGREE